MPNRCAYFSINKNLQFHYWKHESLYVSSVQVSKIVSAEIISEERKFLNFNHHKRHKPVTLRSKCNYKEMESIIKSLFSSGLHKSSAWKHSQKNESFYFKSSSEANQQRRKLLKKLGKFAENRKIRLEKISYAEREILLQKILKKNSLQFRSPYRFSTKFFSGDKRSFF